MPGGTPAAGSILLVEEFFAREDGRFLDELRRVSAPAVLAAFAEKWKIDPRPWARAQQRAYLAQPFSCPGHEPIVKRLFKHAERLLDDDGLMAAFLVAFDREVRRVRRRRQRWDYTARTNYLELTLHLPRNTIPHQKEIKGKNPFTGSWFSYRRPIPKNGHLFSYATRYYLRRRAARYFRRLGRQHPERYVSAVCRALKLYTDADFERGEDLLECWGLLQLAFRRSPVLEFGAARVRVRNGRSLTELEPAPRYEALWQAPEARSELVSLAADAPARLIRHWSAQFTRRLGAAQLAQFDLADIFRLLKSPYEEATQLGAELLLSSAHASTLSVNEWLRLLTLENQTVLATVCEAMQKHLSSERLTLAQCVELASAQATPVARLGLKFLQSRSVRAAEERREVAALANAQCEAVAPVLSQWALQWFSAPATYDRELVMPFFDSLNAGVRAGTWRWLAERSPAYDDPVIWARLTETPYDDTRASVVAVLQQRASLPGISASDLAPVWSSVLLNVHRGGRNKIKAAQQIAQAISRAPDRADTLLPVLVAAVRSVRLAEMRTGLAAVMQVLAARPELAPRVQALLPELRCDVSEGQPCT